MKYLLLENPKYLLLFLGIIDLILIFFLKNIPFEKKKIIIIIIAILIPSIHILAKVIDTDNEKIERVLIKISRNANILQVNSIKPFLSNNFKGKYNNKNYNKKEFIKLLKKKVGKKIINGINFKKIKISFIKNHAKSVIISYIDLTTNEGVFRLSLSWNIEWIKNGKNWYLYRTDSPKTLKF